MDFRLYDEALGSISDFVISNYFGGDKDKFQGNKAILFKKFDKNNYFEPQIFQPIDTQYFRSNFIFLCQNQPNLVGSILLLNSSERQYLLNDLKKTSNSRRLSWEKIPSIKTISAAEQIFQVVKEKTVLLLNAEKVYKKDIEEILSNIIPLFGAKSFNDVQFIYWVLYCELLFTIQIIKPQIDFNGSFSISENWLNLRLRDLPLLSLLNNTGFKTYQSNSFKKDTIVYLIDYYNKKNKAIEIDKSENVISDSIIKIKMIPKPGKPADNIIIINNNKFEKVRNVPFELLYYLLWLRIHNLDVSTGLETNETINPEHINEMTKYNVMIKRFGAVWNNAINPGMKEAKSTAVSDINKILKNQLKINFVAIKEDSGYYKLSSQFKQEDIELEPF